MAKRVVWTAICGAVLFVSMDANAETYNLRIEGAGKAFSLKSEKNLVNLTKGLTLTRDGKLAISCGEKLTCNDSTVEATLDDTKLSGTTADGVVSFPFIAADAQGGTVVISYNKEAAKPALAVIKPREPSNPGPNAPSTNVNTLVAKACNTDTLPAYLPEQNLANLVVTPTGNVIGARPVQIDEDDTIVVHVVADKRLVPNLRVKRKSPFRTAGGLSILGAGLQVPGLQRQAAGDDECAILRVQLSDFEPGRGEIEISTLTTEGETVLGTIEIRINRLYHGMFSLGAAWTDVEDPHFAVVAGPNGATVTRTEPGNNDLQYVLFFTPFVWGPRDIEKEPALLSALVSNRASVKGTTLSVLRHINPSVGLVPNSDIAENAYFGGTLDLFEGFLFTAGVHVRKVDVLTSTSGLMQGSIVGSVDTTLPIGQEWDTGFFWAVSVDLRAAVELIRTVLGTTGG